MNTIIIAGIGLILLVGIVFLMEWLNTRIFYKDESGLETNYYFNKAMIATWNELKLLLLNDKLDEALELIQPHLPQYSKNIEQIQEFLKQLQGIIKENPQTKLKQYNEEKKEWEEV